MRHPIQTVRRWPRCSGICACWGTWEVEGAFLNTSALLHGRIPCGRQGTAAPTIGEGYTAGPSRVPGRDGVRPSRRAADGEVSAGLRACFGFSVPVHDEIGVRRGWSVRPDGIHNKRTTLYPFPSAASSSGGINRVENVENVEETPRSDKGFPNVPPLASPTPPLPLEAPRPLILHLLHFLHG